MATIAGVTVALFLGAAALRHFSRHRAAPDAVGRVLRLLAAAAAVGIAVALLPFTIEDSGAAAGYLLGVPVVAALCPLLADLAGRAVGVTTAAGALVLLGWSLLLGLGIGLWFAVPAVLLAVAAVAGVPARRAAGPGTRGDETASA
ncbi:hypothetical protein CS0771_75120 [Catellatospora sp. IY07-71]|uniref:hypothetical protein n=1 Tax=Catellatospora sp. IY07-71 TaxID=2728827 RepID=UPI001BB3549B|nr:hypothetical protein [Catellatospora sp. IY07-71]BCJ77968.1 hypothetical protein CS0771_75120 [Catellatospora sp. IY07-71]